MFSKFAYHREYNEYKKQMKKIEEEYLPTLPKECSTEGVGRLTLTDSLISKHGILVQRQGAHSLDFRAEY